MSLLPIALLGGAGFLGYKWFKGHSGANTPPSPSGFAQQQGQTYSGVASIAKGADPGVERSLMAAIVPTSIAKLPQVDGSVLYQMTWTANSTSPLMNYNGILKWMSLVPIAATVAVPAPVAAAVSGFNDRAKAKAAAHKTGMAPKGFF